MTDDGVEGSFKLKPMDHIAARVGWVAITAARLETVIGIILVKLHGEEREAELLGRRWRDTYEDAKRTYARLKDDAAVRGDDDDAAACERFADALGRANMLMQRRHHVLHAVWTADPEVVRLDGARRHSVRGVGGTGPTGPSTICGGSPAISTTCIKRLSRSWHASSERSRQRAPN